MNIKNKMLRSIEAHLGEIVSGTVCTDVDDIISLTPIDKLKEIRLLSYWYRQISESFNLCNYNAVFETIAREEDISFSQMVVKRQDIHRDSLLAIVSVLHDIYAISNGNVKNSRITEWDLSVKTHDFDAYEEILK